MTVELYCKLQTHFLLHSKILLFVSPLRILCSHGLIDRPNYKKVMRQQTIKCFAHFSTSNSSFHSFDSTIHSKIHPVHSPESQPSLYSTLHQLFCIALDFMKLCNNSDSSNVTFHIIDCVTSLCYVSESLPGITCIPILLADPITDLHTLLNGTFLLFESCFLIFAIS